MTHDNFGLFNFAMGQCEPEIAHIDAIIDAEDAMERVLSAVAKAKHDSDLERAVSLSAVISAYCKLCRVRDGDFR